MKYTGKFFQEKKIYVYNMLLLFKKFPDKQGEATWKKYTWLYILFWNQEID